MGMEIWQKDCYLFRKEGRSMQNLEHIFYEIRNFTLMANKNEQSSIVTSIKRFNQYLTVTGKIPS